MEDAFFEIAKISIADKQHRYFEWSSWFNGRFEWVGGEMEMGETNSFDKPFEKFAYQSVYISISKYDFANIKVELDFTTQYVFGNSIFQSNATKSDKE